jgi:hypothetical protein
MKQQLTAPFHDFAVSCTEDQRARGFIKSTESLTFKSDNSPVVEPLACSGTRWSSEEGRRSPRWQDGSSSTIADGRGRSGT